MAHLSKTRAVSQSHSGVSVKGVWTVLPPTPFVPPPPPEVTTDPTVSPFSFSKYQPYQVQGCGEISSVHS